MTTTARNTIRYSWRPDTPNHKDFKYKLRKLTLPPVVAPIGMDNPIENQGNLGSCTGNSSTSMLEINLQRKTRSQVQPPLSRLMAYYTGRLIENTVNSDAGCEIRDVIKGLVKTGVCQEVLWPYRVSAFKRRPTNAAYDDAAKIRDRVAAAKLSYYRLNDANDALNCLASGYTFVFGFSVPETFENLPANGILPLPTKNTQWLGGHAVVGVGYDLSNAKQQYIWVRNSWGADWGLKGLFKMPLSWFNDPRRLVDDMWTLQ